MISFKNTLADIGEIEKGSTGHVAEWEFIGDVSNIAYWKTDCSCTANLKIEGNKLIAIYTDSTNLSEEKIEENYPGRVMNFVKGISIYLRDEEELYILNGNKKGFILNPNKSRLRLQLKGSVKL